MLFFFFLKLADHPAWALLMLWCFFFSVFPFEHRPEALLQFILSAWWHVFRASVLKATEAQTHGPQRPQLLKSCNEATSLFLHCRHILRHVKIQCFEALFGFFFRTNTSKHLVTVITSLLLSESMQIMYCRIFLLDMFHKFNYKTTT